MSKVPEETSPLLNPPFSPCANNSIQKQTYNEEPFYDVSERSSSFASTSHCKSYDVTERTSSFASISQYTFYDATERTSSCSSQDAFYDVNDHNGNDDNNKEIFYDVKERASSSRYTTSTTDTDTGKIETGHAFGRAPISKVPITLSSNYGSVNCNAMETQRNIIKVCTSNRNDTHMLTADQQDTSAQTPRPETDPVHESEWPGDVPPCSPNKAQFLSTLILLLFGIALVPSISLVSQYLTVRWRLESGLNKSQEVNQSHCNTHRENVTNSFEDELSTKVSTETTYYNYVISAVSSVTCLVLGAYADVIGRRIIIIFPAFTAVLHFVIVICIMRFDLDTNYFYVSSVVIGLGGSFYSMLIGVFTVTADVNDAKGSRVLWLALQMCVTSVCLALGNIGLGYVIKYVGFYQAAIMLEIFAIITFLTAFLFMPETLHKQRKYKAVKASLNPLNTVGRVFRIYTMEGTRQNRACLWLCMILFFFAVIPDLQLYGLDTLYQLHQPLCWDSTQIGYYGAIQTGGKKLAGTILLKVLQIKGWIKVEKLAMVVCLFQAGSMALEALLQHTWQMYLVPVIGTPAVITIPVIRGIMSFLVGPHNLGALFASIAFIETICSMVASTSINRLYTATVHLMPGAVYFLLASFAVLNFFMFIPFFYIYEDPTNKKNEENGNPC